LHARSFQLEQGASDNPRALTVTRYVSNMSDEKANEFHQRLEALLEEFIDADTKNPDQQSYAMTIALYPSFYFREFNSEANE
jgi:hypothetical protein